MEIIKRYFLFIYGNHIGTGNLIVVSAFATMHSTIVISILMELLMVVRRGDTSIHDYDLVLLTLK